MISSTSDLKLAPSPTTIADLSADQQERLTQLLDRYLRGLEQGEPVDTERMLGENGDLANVLRAYLAKLDGLHGIAAGFQQHGELEPLVWVTDFGLARCQNDLSLTLSGDLVGRMRYMSPEQAGGCAELVDHRTDIYSLAATLYEMLTGRFAVKGDDGPSVLSEIANGSPPRVRRTMPQIPNDLEVVLQKAMSKERDDRYTTTHEFADDLKAVLEDRPTLAKPPSIPLIVRRWASRHRRLFASASLVFVIGMLGMFASVVIVTEKNRDVKASYQRADLYFRQAQETVDQLGSRVAAQLASVPGTEHIRQSLLRNTLAYYQEFVAHAAGDRQLRSELALTHSRIGALVKELESAERSIPHYRRSAEIYRELMQQTPHSPALVQGMAQNMNQLGLALFAADQTTKAKAKYEQAIELQRELVEANDEMGYQTELALTKSNLGLLLSQIGQIDRARVELTEAIEYLTDATEDDGSDVLAGRGLAAALANLSSLSIDTNPRQSILLLEQAIDHQLRITNNSPNRLKASSEIATTYNSLGAAYSRSSEARKAGAAFSKAVRIQRQLHSIAPLVDRYRFDLAISLNNLAMALHSQENHRGANEAAGEAVSLQRTCLQHATPHASSLSRLGAMFNNLGTSREALADTGGAVTAFKSAVTHQQAAISIDPESQHFKQYLLQHFSNLLRVQIREQQWPDALLTSKAYHAAAIEHPAALLAVAEDIARLSKLAPPGAQRQRVTLDVARALVSARKAGAEFDSSLLLREPFCSLASNQSLRKAVQP